MLVTRTDMKRTLTTLLTALAAVIFSFSLNAQENQTEDLYFFDEWKHAFSPEGKKNWKSEFTVRYRNGLFTDGPMATGGIRIDEKRTLGLFLGLSEDYDDATPAFIYSVRTGVTFRRYWHMGSRKIFSFYSDLYAGAGYIYKVTDPESYARKGEFLFVGGWQPGIRVRFFRNIHLFLGPTIATDCLGLHLGIGF